MTEAAAVVRRLMSEADADVTRPGGGRRRRCSTPAAADDAARWRREVDLLLAERDRLARGPGPLEVALPAHLSVSQLVLLRRDPQALARSLRRPMPPRPDPYARRGTAFHAWLEQRFGAVRLLDVDELPGAADDDAAPDDELAELQEPFLASEWADRTPVEVEVPFATAVAGVVLRGRMDAVFADPGGRFDVVDWKTGRRPAGADGARPRSSSPRTGWPGPIWPACRSSRSGRRSTTSAPARPSARSTCSTPPAWPPWSPPYRRSARARPCFITEAGLRRAKPPHAQTTPGLRLAPTPVMKHGLAGGRPARPAGRCRRR